MGELYNSNCFERKHNHCPSKLNVTLRISRHEWLLCDTTVYISNDTLKITVFPYILHVRDNACQMSYLLTYTCISHVLSDNAWKYDVRCRIS